MKDNEKLNIQVDPPRKIYFYQRGDGSIFACREGEAHTNENWKIYKLVGVSDGKLFHEKMKQLRDEANNLTVEEAQVKIREAYAEEQASAMGHIETPPNTDFIRGTNNMNPRLVEALRKSPHIR